MADLIGRGVVLGAPDSGPPDARHEAMWVLAGVARGELLVLLLSDCVLVLRGGRRRDREVTDAQRVTWISDRPPAFGDGRVAVAEPGGVALLRPSNPMQLGERRPMHADRPDLVGRRVPEAGGGTVERALVTSAAWALLLEDGSVVTATAPRDGDGPPPTDPGDEVTLSADRPVVVDRPGAPIDVLEQHSLRLAPVAP